VARGSSASPRSLRAGSTTLAVLAALALLAPVIATDRPWVARDAREQLVFPVFRIRSGDPPSASRAIVRAPVPYRPETVNLDAVLEPPSSRHWLGTDGLGRDLAARLIHGARVSLGVGALSALLALLVGLPLGAAAGYHGGWADAAVSRSVEAVLCFPSLLLALALLAAAPPWLADLPDALRVAVVLGLTGWTGVARYLRGEFLKLVRSDLAASARATGAGAWRVVTRHLLPSALAPVLVITAFTAAGAILLEGALSFLGLGVRPPTPTWGGLLTEARAHVDQAWWLALFPGAALFVAVLGCNLLGEGIRDLLDPRSERTR
jgi:peptide/nickel transport system permease protein